MRTRVTLLVILLIITMLFACINTGALVQLGDANGDGKINSIDTILLERHIASWKGYDESKLVLDALDIDGDGEVTPDDSVKVIRNVAGWQDYTDLSEMNPTYVAKHVSPVKSVSFKQSGMYLGFIFEAPDDMTGIDHSEMILYNSADRENIAQHMPIDSNSAYFLLDKFITRYDYDKIEVTTFASDANYENTTVTLDIDISFDKEYNPEFTAEIDSFGNVEFNTSLSKDAFAKIEYFEFDGNNYLPIAGEFYQNMQSGSFSVSPCDNAAELAENDKLYAKVSAYGTKFPSSNKMTWDCIKSDYIKVEPYTPSVNPPAVGESLPITGVYFDMPYENSLELCCNIKSGVDTSDIFVIVSVSKDNSEWTELRYMPLDTTIYLSSVSIPAGEYKYLKIESEPYAPVQYDPVVFDIDLTVEDITDNDITANVIEDENGDSIVFLSGLPADSCINFDINNSTEHNSYSFGSDANSNGVWYQNIYADILSGSGVTYTISSSSQSLTGSTSATITNTYYACDKTFEEAVIERDDSILTGFEFINTSWSVEPSITYNSGDIIDSVILASKDNGTTWAGLGVGRLDILNLSEDTYTKLRIISILSDGSLKYTDVDVNIVIEEFSPALSIELNAERSQVLIGNLLDDAVSVYDFKLVREGGKSGIKGSLYRITDGNSFINANIPSNAISADVRIMQVLNADGNDLNIRSTGWTGININN